MNEDIFLVSRRKFNVSFTDLVEFAKLRLIEQSSIEQAIRNSDDRDSLINELRNLGMSLEDIGNAFSLTRERIRQLTEAGLTSIYRRNKPAKSIEDVRIEIWKQAILDKSWWHDTYNRHTLRRDKVVLTIRSYGYNKAEAEKLCTEVISSKSMACMILIVSHGIPEEKHREWIMNLRLSNKTQKEICEIVNSKQPIKMHVMTWNRYCKSLGLREMAGTQSKRTADEFNPKFGESWHSKP